MKLFRFQPTIYYEVPEAGGGQPTAQPTPTPQPQGQGQGQGDGFRTTFFPGVPDEHWQLIEPHVSNINKHVTQLQQRYAPFNSYTPEAVQGLARFADDFERDPSAQWIRLARTLQQAGQLDPDLDVDHLEQLVTQQMAEEAQSGSIDGLDGDDPRDQAIQQLMQTVQQLQQRLDQGEQKNRQTVEDRALDRTKSWMKQQLTKAGLPENLMTDQRLIGMFVSHGGNAQAAVQDAIEYRNAVLGGVVPDPKVQQRSKQLDMPNGVPKTTAPKSGGNRRGMFGGVSAAAEQALARSNQS
jgi:hypothetical protein